MLVGGAELPFLLAAVLSGGRARPGPLVSPAPLRTGVTAGYRRGLLPLVIVEMWEHLKGPC